MTYEDRLKKHLVQYKHEIMGDLAPGVYRRGDREVLHEHILPDDKKWLNLLEGARPGVRAFLDSHPEVKLHRDFHHLNSSQAFALNLFVPYLEGGLSASSAMLHAFGQTETLRDWRPEAVPVGEEGTNIDALWTTSDGTTTFCEVKLSESEFGKATRDQPHLDKLSKFYAPVLTGHIDDDLLEPAEFFNHYQMLRNVWHMVREPGSRLVFLLPRANEKIWPVLDQFLPRILPDTRARIAVVAIEDLIERLCSDAESPESLRVHAEELHRKYVLKTVTG